MTETSATRTITGEARVTKVNAWGPNTAVCRVTTATIGRDMDAEIVRGGEIVHRTTLRALRELGHDVQTVDAPSQCQLTLASDYALVADDIIRASLETHITTEMVEGLIAKARAKLAG